MKLVSAANQGSSTAVGTPNFDGQRDRHPVLSEQEKLEWIVLGKVTTRAFGLVLENLLREIVPLESEITYWSDILGSYRYTSLYSVQTYPMRMWKWSHEVWQDVRAEHAGLRKTWNEFYNRVRSGIGQKSLQEVRTRISLPMTLIRRDLQKKQANLENLKRQYAASIGYLLSQGLEISKAASSRDFTTKNATLEIRKRVSQYLSAMDAAITANLRSEDIGNRDSRSTLTPVVDVQTSEGEVAPEIFSRLQSILQQRLPEQTAQLQSIKQENGRPSRVARYWLPATALLLSSSTILRIILNHKAEILQWFRNFGDTALDFYFNWVIEPGRRLIGTIRHDEDSEVSIMSKQSLEGDRASLERMVVDFAVQHPDGPNLTETDIANVQAKVRAGDLTPVLKAYEHELQRPVYGSIRGNLIRTLLIQIQKTKVDVEVAMGGIDALLKSQELVFGFMSLTPGLLVLIGSYRWLTGLFSNRKSFRQGEIQGRSARLYRNMDRILTSHNAGEGSSIMDYESFGLLVCEAVVLRDLAANTMSKQVFAEFTQDFDCLMDLQSGIACQARVADRMRWAYAKWLL